ncbi:TonB-dependent receptor domain-containing protein [Paraburkholderia sp. JPY419]|uniref:TonB-dependent receptor domain-containing protein n=1 Tax=Paraburkholderia sp. JPY419 TaxID=667660 RepID=UPI003D24C07C
MRPWLEKLIRWGCPASKRLRRWTANWCSRDTSFRVIDTNCCLLTVESCRDCLKPGAGKSYGPSRNARDNSNADASLNFAFISQNFTMNDTMLTLKPYLQCTWQLQNGSTITPGLKYVSFHRSIDTPMNQKTGEPLDFRHTWDKVLPSLILHQQITPQWSAYAQYAQGFLAPSLPSIRPASVCFRFAPITA